MAVVEPDIWAFERYREYLLAWKAAGGRVRSYAWIGRKLDTAGAHVHAMLNADPPVNIEGAWTDRWVPVLKLEGDAEAYFRALVTKDLGATAGLKRLADAAARSLLRKHQALPVTVDDLPLVANWYYSATLALGRIPGFTGDPDDVVATLVPPISPEMAREALEFLLGRGHLRREGEVVRAPAHYALVVEDPELKRDAMRAWYAWFMRRGPEAMEEFGANERHFGSAVVTLPASRYAEAVRIVEGAMQALLALDGGVPGEEHRVYAATLQLFPVSKRGRA